jgi:hypothetical protein
VSSGPYNSSAVVPFPRPIHAVGQQNRATRVLGTAGDVFGIVSLLVIAIAGVSAVAGLNAPPKAAAGGPALEAPHLTAHPLDVPDVEHSYEQRPRWLVEPPRTSPLRHFLYRSAGVTVGLAGGFYMLVLTA